MSIASRTVTLAQFLEMPETEPASEYIDGRIVQKVSPKARHSAIQGKMVEEINRYAETRKTGRAFPELRCTFAGRSLVDDVCFFRMDRIAYGPDGELVDDVFLAPDLAVEILSPGQSPTRAAEKLRFSLKNGVRLGWFIDPGRHAARVFESVGRPRSLSADDLLDGGEVLPAFRLPLVTVFDWMRKP